MLLNLLLQQIREHFSGNKRRALGNASTSVSWRFGICGKSTRPEREQQYTGYYWQEQTR